jgi:hypothetical protein
MLVRAWVTASSQEATCAVTEIGRYLLYLHVENPSRKPDNEDSNFTRNPIRVEVMHIQYDIFGWLMRV